MTPPFEAELPNSYRNTSLHNNIHPFKFIIQLNHRTINLLLHRSEHIDETLCNSELELADTLIEVLLDEEHSLVYLPVLLCFLYYPHIPLVGHCTQ